MKQVLEFEKPIVKLREEIEEAKKKLASKPSDKLAQQIADLEAKADALHRDIHANLSPWQRVQISRHIARPFMLDYVKHICDEFVELHGDRHIGDDNAMPAGFATIAVQRVAILAPSNVRDTQENLLRNLGSPHPQGYRKALHEHGAHRAAGRDAVARGRGLHEHARGAVAAEHLVVDGAALEGDLHHVAAGLLHRLLHRDGDLARLALAHADRAVAVAHHRERGEAEDAAALDDLRHPVHRDHLLPEAVAALVVLFDFRHVGFLWSLRAGPRTSVRLRGPPRRAPSRARGS